ncbi:splicing factor U2AF subunit [Colletotrichum spaethianum]|uniref:Splicing factor U2AF subunit n=1 Tax=Colletotrichum spaethianum TaxID=700344 RepID=A0AA37L502_9PEZI|nr:splicing factor U2AF subunit [Colletotrichum spaethianum]GKT41942.1 splicing factor U2AF subunit [Colletotrichum spaethianum]
MNGDGYSRGFWEEGRGKGSRDYPRDRDDRRGDRDRHRDRRRSRSPYDRSSRRRDDEDSYATSRSHREREREDRYSGRERRGGDREWDRDRASSRRDARREDDDRPRRDRDPYDDRRRGGRDRNEDASFGRRERQRSATPPPKKREPTPDLTNVTSVLERKRRLTQWDIKPPGYENVTAEQAKLSGMFPLPGAPRQQPMDPSKLQAIMNQPGGQVNSAALKPSNSRQAKRLLINNLPPSATEESIQNFFNLQLNGLNIIESTDPCTSCQLSKDHSFAVVEFRNASEATVALALDGISMEADDATNGEAADQGLVIRRPKDYIVPAVVDDVPYEPGVVSNVVIDTPNKISIANMPSYLSDEQVSELLVSFGELKAFVLVRDRSTEESRGIAFCEYVDPAATDVAIQGLNGMDLGDKKLRVQKASVGVTQVAGVEMGVAAMSMLAGTTSTDSEETRVLQLLNMVTPEELMDNDDYEEIKEDVQEECSKFGTVLDIKIPRPVGGSRQSAGVGKIFVKFETKESAKKALQALAGRKFADRTVVTTYFPEVNSLDSPLSIHSSLIILQENFEVGAW